MWTKDKGFPKQKVITSIYKKGGRQGRLQNRDDGQAQSFVMKENEEKAVQSGKQNKTAQGTSRFLTYSNGK